LLDRPDVGVMLPEQIGKQPMVVEVQFERVVSKGCSLRNNPSLASSSSGAFADPQY
jgi:hypothetical protein